MQSTHKRLLLNAERRASGRTSYAALQRPILHDTCRFARVLARLKPLPRRFFPMPCFVPFAKPPVRHGKRVAAMAHGAIRATGASLALCAAGLCRRRGGIRPALVRGYCYAIRPRARLLLRNTPCLWALRALANTDRSSQRERSRPGFAIS